MAFDMQGLKDLPGKIGDYLSSGAGPVALGMGAQAAMEDNQNSWQAMLGRAGVELGRSNIAANAAKKQAAERNSLANMLAQALRGESFQFTEPGKAGPTDMSFKTGPGGDTVTLKGDQLMRPVTDPGSTGAAPRRTSGANVPTRPVGNVGANDMLPFLLAQTVTGGGGGGSNLAGLTPEQITPISRTDIAGQNTLQQGVNSIFQNMVRKAQADYYNRPQPTKQAMSFSDMKLNPETGTWQYFDRVKNQMVDTGIKGEEKPTADQLSFTNMKISDDTGTWQYFDRVKNQMVDTGIRATDEERSGQRQPNWRTEEFIDKQGVRQRGIFKDGQLFQPLGVSPEPSTQEGRAFGQAKDLADIEARIQGDDAVESDYDNFNSRSEGNMYYIHRGSRWGKNYRAVPLPTGVRARDMHETLQKHPELNIDQVLQILEQNQTR